MYLYIILILVTQICYCSANCTCSCGIAVPVFAICLIGLIILALLLTTIALGVYVYRLKRGRKRIDSVYEVNRHASMTKYERQILDRSQCMILENGIEDDTMQLNKNEYSCDADNRDVIPNEASVVSEPKKILKLNKVPIFPQMKVEHLYALCEAVNKHRLKECTSLSDLDKIVNDAKEEAKEKSKIPDISASTPALDVCDDIPSPAVKKVSAFDVDSKRSKLREEIMKKFNQDTTQAEKNVNKKHAEVNDEETKSVDPEKTSLKPDKPDDEDEISFKLTQYEMMAKTIQDELKSKLNQKQNKKIKIQSKDDQTDTADKIAVVQEDIYDCSPVPALQAVYDILPSPKSDNKSPLFPSSPELNELYDFPPLPKPNIELKNKPTSPVLDNEVYDFPPLNAHSKLYTSLSSKPLDEVYESVPTTRSKNRVVSDGNNTGYLLPLSAEATSSNETQYSNAKTPLNQS